VYLLLCFDKLGRLIEIMTGVAVFLLVAIDAAQAEKIDMLLMVEGYYRAGFVWRVINSLIWYRNDGMRYSHYIGGIFIGGLHKFAVDWIMAHDALGIMAPFAMAAETLPMIGAFEAGLAEICRVGLAAMALAARLNLAGRAVMMAGLASLVHAGHLGMNLMIKMHRPILIDKLIQKH
jgi:hypothetical protein